MTQQAENRRRFEKMEERMASLEDSTSDVSQMVIESRAQRKKRFEKMEERMAYLEEMHSDLLQLVMDTRAELIKPKKPSRRPRRSTRGKKRR